MKKIILPLLLSAGLVFAQYEAAPQPPAGYAEETGTAELPAAEYPPQDPNLAETNLQQPLPTNAEYLLQEDMPAYEEAPADETNPPAVPSQYPADELPYADYQEYGYLDYEPQSSQPRPELYPDLDPNKVQGIIIQMPFTNITIKPPFAPYQTYDTSRLKSKRIPEMMSGSSLLQNLDKTSWRLKFYAHPDIQHMDSLLLDIAENDLKVTSIPKAVVSNIPVMPAVSNTNIAPLQLQVPQSNQTVSSYRLTLVKNLRPGEGIYAYDAGKGAIHFMYIRLLIPHMLAFDMAESYDEIALCPDKSLTDLGVFTLE